jgi:hypothetical protein
MTDEKESIDAINDSVNEHFSTMIDLAKQWFKNDPDDIRVLDLFSQTWFKQGNQKALHNSLYTRMIISSKSALVDDEEEDLCSNETSPLLNSRFKSVGTKGTTTLVEGNAVIESKEKDKRKELSVVEGSTVIDVKEKEKQKELSVKKSSVKELSVKELSAKELSVKAPEIKEKVPDEIIIEDTKKIKSSKVTTITKASAKAISSESTLTSDSVKVASSKSSKKIEKTGTSSLKKKVELNKEKAVVTEKKKVDVSEKHEDTAKFAKNSVENILDIIAPRKSITVPGEDDQVSLKKSSNDTLSSSKTVLKVAEDAPKDMMKDPLNVGKSLKVPTKVKTKPIVVIDSDSDDEKADKKRKNNFEDENRIDGKKLKLII